jgi:hypothetical protein
MGFYLALTSVVAGVALPHEPAPFQDSSKEPINNIKGYK